MNVRIDTMPNTTAYHHRYRNTSCNFAYMENLGCKGRLEPPPSLDAGGAEPPTFDAGQMDNCLLYYYIMHK